MENNRPIVKNKNEQLTSIFLLTWALHFFIMNNTIFNRKILIWRLFN